MYSFISVASTMYLREARSRIDLKFMVFELTEFIIN